MDSDPRSKFTERFKTIRRISTVLFIVTIIALIFLVRWSLKRGVAKNLKFGFLYVFVSIVIAVSIAVVIGCTVILHRLKKENEAVPSKSDVMPADDAENEADDESDDSQKDG